MVKKNKDISGRVLLIFAVTIIGILFLSSLSSTPTDLILSSEESGGLDPVGPNTIEAPLSVSSIGDSFDGERPTVLETQSFSNLYIDSSECIYRRSAPSEYALNEDTYFMVDSTSVGGDSVCRTDEYIYFMWGSENPSWAGTGDELFSTLWKVSSAREEFQANKYYVSSYFPATFTYACYECEDVPYEQKTCTDTDGGIVKDVQGQVHVVLAESDLGFPIDSKYTDHCDGNSVVEYSCGSDGDVVATLKNCWFSGCENGACGGEEEATNYFCVESDGGLNYNSFSDTQLYLGSQTIDIKYDHCSGDVLTEYYCTNSHAESITEISYTCPGGCEGGECVPYSVEDEEAEQEQQDQQEQEDYDSCESRVCYSDNVYCMDSEGSITNLMDDCSSTEQCVSSGGTASCSPINSPDPVSDGCDSDSDCSVGEECLSGECLETDYEEQAQKVCDGEIAKWLDSDQEYSSTIQDCAVLGYDCVNGACVPQGNIGECESDNDCGEDKPYCSEDGACVECLLDDQCFRPGSIMRCESNSCVNMGSTPVPPTPTPDPDPVPDPVSDDEDYTAFYVIGGLVIVAGAVYVFKKGGRGVKKTKAKPKKFKKRGKKK